LNRAIINSQLDRVKRAIAAGIDVNGDGTSPFGPPLFVAAMSGGECCKTGDNIYNVTGSVEIVELLLSKGANPNFADKSGKTPLHIASGTSSNSAVVRLLLDAGANPNAQTAVGSSPLHSAVKYDVDSVRLLLAKGARADVTDSGGQTPLHSAAYMADNAGAARLLIAGGANVNARDDQGRTPLDIATASESEPRASSRFAEVVKLLKESGAKKGAALPAARK
jgi:ankyrin repeat protein